MRDEVKSVTGSIQCQGLTSACEAAYKAVDEMYQEGKVILILDAEAAYNNMNRSQALNTAFRKAPQVYTPLYNFYQGSTRGFHAGKELSIEEGVIQGCSLASAFYDLGMSTLVTETTKQGISQIWLCDDVSAAGEPNELKAWLDLLKEK